MNREQRNLAIELLTDTFGQTHNQASEWVDAHQPSPADLLAWTDYLEEVRANTKINDPLALVASEMKKGKTPRRGKARVKTGRHENPKITQCKELARKGAFRTDSKGRKWFFEYEGLHCPDVGDGPLITLQEGGMASSGAVPYPDLLDHLDELMAQVRLPAGVEKDVEAETVTYQEPVDLETPF